MKKPKEKVPEIVFLKEKKKPRIADSEEKIIINTNSSNFNFFNWRLYFYEKISLIFNIHEVNSILKKL